MDHISQLDNRLPSKNGKASFLNLIREIPKRYIKVILIYENNWYPQRIRWTSPTIGVNIRAVILIECESYKFYLWLCRTANADERNTALLKRWRFNAPIRHKESRRPYRVVKNAPRVRPIFFLPRWIVKRLAFFSDVSLISR